MCKCGLRCCPEVGKNGLSMCNELRNSTAFISVVHVNYSCVCTSKSRYDKYIYPRHLVGGCSVNEFASVKLPLITRLARVQLSKQHPEIHFL